MRTRRRVAESPRSCGLTKHITATVATMRIATKSQLPPRGLKTIRGMSETTAK